jgi:hypothetical protein
MSHVYLPYTISALLNVLDFSKIETPISAPTGTTKMKPSQSWENPKVSFVFSYIQSELRDLASVVLNSIIKQVLLCTTDTGIVSFTASCRTDPAHRQRPYGHNINQLIRLITCTHKLMFTR